MAPHGDEDRHVGGVAGHRFEPQELPDPALLATAPGQDGVSHQVPGAVEDPLELDALGGA